MTTTNKTLVTFLLDRTGSMQSIKDDTIGAFNSYLDELQKGGDDILFTLIQFDSTSTDKICVRTPVAEAPRLDHDNFKPRDMTPLIDASVKTIKAVERSLAEHPADKVVICILTDGDENRSTEYTWDNLAALIKEKREAGWQFNFMGAGIDAYKQGARMGILPADTMSYDSHDSQKTREAFASAAVNTRGFASGTRSDTSWSTEQKKAAGDIFDKPAKKPEQKRVSMVDDFTL